MRNKKYRQNKVPFSDLILEFTMQVNDIIMDCKLNIKNGVTSFELEGIKSPLSDNRVTFKRKSMAWRI